ELSPGSAGTPPDRGCGTGPRSAARRSLRVRRAPSPASIDATRAPRHPHFAVARIGDNEPKLTGRQAVQGDHIRCLVADDHEALRDGMRRILSRYEDIEVAGTARDGDEAAALIARRRPNVAVLDARMPGRGGIELCAELSAAGSETAVVIYTGFGEAE